MVQQTRPRRRALGLLAAVALAAAACGGDDGAGGAEPREEADTRLVDTELGQVEVPLRPERVVALDEYAALNMMALGHEPVLVFASYQSEVGGVVLDDAGIEVQAATAEEGPNFEAVAAALPDLIVYTTEGAVAPSFERLSEIAPAVSLPYNVPWREAITATAEVFGEEGEGQRLIGVLEDHLAPLQEAVAAEPRSMSVLGDTYGLVFGASMDSPLAAVLEEAGFDRPAAQAEGTPDPTFTAAVVTSLETIGDHDADLVIVLSGAYYRAETFLEAPTFQVLPAVQDGRSFVVDGDMWFGTYPFAIYWLVEDLRALQAGEGQEAVGTLDDVDARWAAFQELSGGAP